MNQSAQTLLASPPISVLGRYEMLIPIGSGGMATVWAARLRGSRGFQRTVAVKTILPEFVRDPNFDRMFLEEASLASRIHHPHVAEILDLAEHDGVLYLVMEWVDGETVGTLLKGAQAAGGIPISVAARIIRQACAGLHAAHELRDEAGNPMGLVHLDVSPQNVLVTLDGIVKIVDFGIAKAAGRAADEASATHIRGKAPYMSPEQALGEDVDRRSDIFALGVLLYWMTTGVHPFRGKTQDETLSNIRAYTAARAPSELRADYPPALEQVVMKALARRRDDRFANANELLHALDKAMPEAAQANTDEDIAFLHRVLGEKHEQRRAALKTALAAADSQAAHRMLEQANTDRSGSTTRARFRSGFRLLPAAEVEEFVRAELADRHLAGAGESAETTEQAMPPAGAIRQPWSGRRLAIASALGFALSVIGLIVWYRGAALSASSTSPAAGPSLAVAADDPPEAARSTVALERLPAQPAQGESPSAMAAQAPLAGSGPGEQGSEGAPEAAPAASADGAGLGAAGAAYRGRKFVRGPGASAANSATPGQPQDRRERARGFVSPVRDPGF